MESCRSSYEAKSEEHKSPNGSPVGRLGHRLSRESLGAHNVSLGCGPSLEIPSLGRFASTTITEGLLASVTESGLLCFEEEVGSNLCFLSSIAHASTLTFSLRCLRAAIEMQGGTGEEGEGGTGRQEGCINLRQCKQPWGGCRLYGVDSHTITYVTAGCHMHLCVANVVVCRMLSSAQSHCVQSSALQWLLGLLLQIEDVVTATKAAQALVEKAHREIELSGIRPVLRLASLDTKIPLSLLRLPSDPSIPPQVPANEADLEALTIDPDGLLNLGRPPVVKRALRRVSWNSQQLAQVMSGVGMHKPSLMGDHSTEAVAGSPEKDRDPLSPDTQPLHADSSSSGTTSRRSLSRIISPFALKPAPSQS